VVGDVRRFWERGLCFRLLRELRSLRRLKPQSGYLKKSCLSIGMQTEPSLGGEQSHRHLSGAFLKRFLLRGLLRRS
jgi:hypothetical protein